jgi:hypothetical protein
MVIFELKGGGLNEAEEYSENKRLFPPMTKYSFPFYNQYPV